MLSSASTRRIQEVGHRSRRLIVHLVGAAPISEEELQLHSSTSFATDSGPLRRCSVFDHGRTCQAFLPILQSSVDWVSDKGLEKAGIPTVKGLSSGKLIGHGHYPLSVDPSTEIRSSSESALPQAALGRENLTVYIKTNVDRIVFDNGRANGVKVQSGGVEYNLHASKEVIVSNGVCRSPHLRLLSGVGPKRDLEKLGIRVVTDRSGVDQNLSVSPEAGVPKVLRLAETRWDHMVVETIYPVDCYSLSALQDSATMETAIKKFMNTRNGPLTSIGSDTLDKDSKGRDLVHASEAS